MKHRPETSQTSCVISSSKAVDTTTTKLKQNSFILDTLT